MSTGALNAGLRATGLAARFALSMFMARYMRFEDIGAFALLTGVTGLLPSVVGLGLNYFMCRSLVGISHDSAVDLVRDRLVVTLAAAAISVALLVVLVGGGLLSLPFPVWAACLIIVFELIAFDVQMAQQARGHSTFANINLMLRSGLWVWPFLALAYFVPVLRSVSVLGWFWLGGLSTTMSVLIIVYFRDVVKTILAFDIRRENYLKHVGWRFAALYGSDLGLAGSVYLDRFYISAIAGVRAAGIYFFFVSIANAIYAICQAGTIQIYAPQLRALAAGGGWPALVAGIRPRFRATILNTGVCMLLALPAVWIVIQVTGKAELGQAFDIVPVVLIAFGLKMVSDFYGVLFAAVERDGNYVFFNVLMLMVTLVFGISLTVVMGYRGAALALLLATALVLALKIRSWRLMSATALRNEGPD